MAEDILISELKNKGIVKINNFLNSNEIDKVSKIIKYYSAPKEHPKSYFPTNLSGILIKILNLNFKKFIHSFQILNIARKKKLKRFSEKYFNSKTKLSYIDAYYSRKSNQEILPWHTDQAYSGELNIKNFNDPDDFFLKIFIYLSDVGPNNGCMSYVPESHKIGYAIRKSIFEKKIKYQPYWGISDFKKIINTNIEFFEGIFKNTRILSDFISKTKNLEQKNFDDNFCYEAKAGSAVIFDEGGIHRGSKPQLNDRMVLRYMYSRQK